MKSNGGEMTYGESASKYISSEKAKSARRQHISNHQRRNHEEIKENVSSEKINIRISISRKEKSAAKKKKKKNQ